MALKFKKYCTIYKAITNYSEIEGAVLILRLSTALT